MSGFRWVHHDTPPTATDAAHTAAAGHPGTAGAARRHIPGLTGLRGVAVAAVVAYHLGHLRGGFLGVDLFFVLSGFLITTLLLDRPPRTTGDMARWWGRRIRRLTPAVAVTVVAVSVAFATSSGVALDGLATLTWWQNWHLVAEGTSYWEGAPSPLRHAWSLSIEEQFYLLWPPLLIACLAVTRRFGARRAASARPERADAAVGVVAFVGAATSFAWAAILAGRADADLSRIYFGTDTRVGTLLLGCALAVLVRRRADGPATAAATFSAGVGAGVLVVLSFTLSVSSVWAYRGGLVLAAVAAVVLVAGISRPGPLSRALEWAPLEWLGVRSYAIYLWSWPLQLLLDERIPAMHAALRALAAVAGSLVLADLSLRFVEEPMRRSSTWARRLTLRRAAWVGGTALVALSLAFAASSEEPTVAEKLAEEFERSPDPTTPTGPTTTCVPAAGSGPDWDSDTSAYDPATVERSDDPDSQGCAEATRVLVVGDSTGRGAANGLRRLGATDLEVWDRTELGCGFAPPGPTCPRWRELWTEAVDEVDPDLVLVYLGVSGDLIEGDEPAFLTEAGSSLRRSEFADAVDLLGAGGARLAWVLPPVPMGHGVFYCGGAAEDTPCDPDWVDRWHDDVRAVAADRGVTTIDVREWIGRRSDTADADRPDGLHLSGPALDEHAEWLAEQLRAVAGPGRG